MAMSEIRSAIVDLIDDFIENISKYRNEIQAVVKAKQRRKGYLCVVAIKSVSRDEEVTISKTAMKVKIEKDVKIFEHLLKCQKKFIKECYAERKKQ